MSDVFNLPLKTTNPKAIGSGRGSYPVIIADCEGGMCKGKIGQLRFEQGPHSGTSRYMDYNTAEKMSKSACVAINNHDKLVEALKINHDWLCVNSSYIDSPLYEKNLALLKELGYEI